MAGNPLSPPFIPRFGSGAPSGSAPVGTQYFDTSNNYAEYIYRSGAWHSVAATASNIVYSTGTFTPTLGAGTTNPTGIAYLTQVGNYTRIGRLVLFNASMSFSSVGTGGVGTARLNGLPFTNIAAGINLLGYLQGTAPDAGYVPIQTQIVSSSTSVRFFQQSLTLGIVGQMDISNITSSTVMTAAGSYMTSDP